MSLIPDSLFDDYNTFVDELHTNKFISREVTLFYISTTNCPNCVPGHPNMYNGTGPSPFSFGPCPYCNGNNYIEEEKNKVVRLRVYFNRKDFIKVSNTVVEDAEAQIIFKADLLPSIVKAEYISLFSDLDYGDQKFVLAGDPTPFGFGSTQYSAFVRKR